MVQKSHIWNSFLENVISGIQKFYICPDVSVDIIILFFNFGFSSRKSQSQQKLAKKITHFTIQFCSKNFTHFANLNSLKMICSLSTAKNLSDFTNLEQTCFYLVSEKIFALHHFFTPKNCILETLWKYISVLNVCIFLYISLRKILFQRRSKGCDGEGRGVGRLNNFLKAACCLSLAQCFTIFHFIWYFWKLGYFLGFRYFYL